MLTFDDAISKARSFVKQLECEAGEELGLFDNEIWERPFGWVFFYNTRHFLQTKDIRYALAGNGPLLVDRDKETIIQLGTVFPVERYIEHYEKTGTVL